MVKAFQIKRATGWIWVALGVSIVLAIALDAINIYAGQKEIAPFAKQGADAGSMLIPPIILNMIAWLIYSIIMLSVGAKLWDIGFKMIKESKE